MLSFLHYPHLTPLQEGLRILYEHSMWLRMLSPPKNLTLDYPWTITLEAGRLSIDAVLLREGVVQCSCLNQQEPSVICLTENGELWLDDDCLSLPTEYRVTDFTIANGPGRDTLCKLLLVHHNRLLVGYCSTQIDLTTFRQVPSGCFLEMMSSDFGDVDGAVVHPVRGDLYGYY